MASNGPATLYEHQQPEDYIVTLHQLCPTCTRLQRKSQLLRDLFNREEIRLNVEELFDRLPVTGIKAGYLNGCHLCALIWVRAGAHLFDPVKRSIDKDEVTISLKARNFELEYELEHRAPSPQKWWKRKKKPIAPVIGPLGVIRLAIPEVWDDEVRLAGSGVFKWSELFIYPVSNPELNPATLLDGPETVSSKHDMKLTTIKEWHQRCTETHSKCVDFSRMVARASELPSRLLDLNGGKVRLLCDVASVPQLQYTTLSHMWGPDPNALLRLTQARLVEFTSEIPLSELSLKYREAIRISRALGFRYIWIDSLCIIQDSKEDWEREALKMASVYGRTACNISYVYPPSEELSRHHLRDPRIEVPCQLFPGSDDQRSASREDRLLVQDETGFASRFWTPNTYKDLWPLLSRAWVFQERLLCSRNIYYGQGRLMWECCERLEDEFRGPLRESPRSKSQFHAVFAGIQGKEPVSMERSFNGQWNLLVQDYRMLELTYERDRVIAFAGIVRAIQSQTKYTYLAGIWKEAADFELLWALSPPSPLGDFVQRKLELGKTAPSWSCFSVPPRTPKSAGRDTIDFNICTQIFTRSMYTVYCAQVVSFQHPTLTSKPDTLLHDFAGLRITLRTRMIPSALQWDGEMLRLLPHGRYELAKIYFEPKNGMKYVHDDASLLPGANVPTETFMILTMLEAWMTRGPIESRYDLAKFSGKVDPPVQKTQWQYAGLVVVRAGKDETGHDTWRRIGVFIFDDAADGVEPFSSPFKFEESEEDIILV